jgi:hypothetical protein
MDIFKPEASMSHSRFHPQEPSMSSRRNVEMLRESDDPFRRVWWNSLMSRGCPCSCVVDAVM